MVLLFLMVLGIAGFFVLDSYQNSVTRRQGRAAAEAVALEVIRALHPPPYAPPALPDGADPRMRLSHLRRLAAANGLGKLTFDPLEADAIEIGPTWVTVRVHSPDPAVGTIRAVAEGIPAGRIAGGPVPGNRTRNAIGSGCAPFCIPVAAVPFADEPTELTFEIGRPPGQAYLISLAGRPIDLRAWIRDLGASITGPVSSIPEMSVGDLVSPADPAPELMSLLQERLEGRIVILPYVHQGRVRGFGRVELAQIDPDTGTLRLVLAPSAVVQSAKPGRSGIFSGGPSSMRVSPFGLALRAQLKG
jgi:hypothetical protein